MITFIVLILTVICLPVDVFGQQAASRWLHTSEGFYRDAKPTDWTTEGWRFKVGSEESRSFDNAKLVRFGRWQHPKTSQVLWLSDGSWLAGDLQMKSSSIIASSDWFKPIEIPVEQIRGILNNPSASIGSWVQTKEWFEAKAGENDYLKLVDGRQVQGLLSFLSDGDQITIQVGERKLYFPMEQVDSIAFSPALFPSDAESAGRMLGLVDGSLLRLRPKDFVPKASEWAIETQSGLSLMLLDNPRDFASEAVSYIVGLPAKSIRLDELTPASYRHQPASSLTWPLGVREDVYGRPLLKDDGLLHSGLAMHSESLASFRWDGTPGVFRAELRFAPTQNGGSRSLGNALCQVLVVKNGAISTQFEQDMRRPSSNSIAVSADVTDAQLIVLTVRQADGEQFGDHLMWLDPRVDPIGNSK